MNSIESDYQPVHGHAGYMVNRAGHFRDAMGTALQPTILGEYPVIALGKALERVHVLVCEAFHGPRPCPTCEVHHKDENRLNFHSDNLEWLSKAAHEKVHKERGRKDHLSLSPRKPYPGFLLSPALDGQWCRRATRKRPRECFGAWANDRSGKRALRKFLKSGQGAGLFLAAPHSNKWEQEIRRRVKRLLKVSNSTVAAMTLLSLNGGLSPKDLAQLKWSNIDAAKKTLTILSSNRKPKVVPLWRRTLNALAKLQPESPLPALSSQRDALVFVTKAGNPIVRRWSIREGSKIVHHGNGNAAFIAFKRACEKAGIEGWSLRSLGQIFATVRERQHQQLAKSRQGHLRHLILCTVSQIHHIAFGGRGTRQECRAA